MDDRTYVPNMNDEFSEAQVKENTFSGAEKVMKRSNEAEVPTVGFLYSISRKGWGEYWPIHLGPNTIGRSGDNDIQLLEGTVSDKHACLSVKKMRTTGNLIASIKDVGSKTGIYLNDQELDFDNYSCKNGDILTIGSNYQLVLILIEAEAYGLNIAENFVIVDDCNSSKPRNSKSGNESSNPAKSQNAVSQTFNPYSSRNRHYSDNGGTVDMNGAGEEFGNLTEHMGD